MKQYQIAFYYSRITAAPAVYYREFDTVKELKEWANSVLNESSLYSHFKHSKIPLSQYLENS